MQRKKKICIECKTPQFIFSKGRCGYCASKTYKKPQHKKKATGEKDLFFEIWQERPHICTNCQTPLGEEAQASFFAHIKPKGKFPELRLDKNNIRLLCFDCHFALDHQTKDKFNQRKKEDE